MKSHATSELLADEAATPAASAASSYHQPNAEGIFEQPEKIFVPVGAGNTCAFYLAHTAEGWRVGWDFWTRQPKNHSTQLPTLQAEEHGLRTTREDALWLLVALARVWFDDHKSIVARVDAWAGEHLPVAAAAGSAVEPADIARKDAVDPAPNAPAVDASPAAGAQSSSAPERPLARYAELPLTEIGRGDNPRKERNPERQSELVDCLRTQPLLHPIVVRDMGEGREGKPDVRRYELIVGEGRLLAYETLGRAAIEARIFTGVDAATALAWALVENLQRDDLNAMDEAEGFQSLARMGWTPGRMAEQTGKKLRTIQAALILTRLPDEGRDAVRDGKLSARQAREIAGRWRDRPEHCRVLIKAAIELQIPSDSLATALPHEAIPYLEGAKLLVRVPWGYTDRIKAEDPYVRLGAMLYCLDVARWKADKKQVDTELKAQRDEQAAKAAAKVEKAKASATSVPLAQLRAAGAEVVPLVGGREIFAEHLPAEFVATTIGADKAEVLVCLRPAELRRIEEAWKKSVENDRLDVLEAAKAKATALVRKLKKVSPREMAIVSLYALPGRSYGYPTSINFQAVGVKQPRGSQIELAYWAKLSPLDQVKVLLALVLDYEDAYGSKDMLCWILGTPKLGLLEEDPKRRDAELARLAAELWPKEEKAPAVAPGKYPAFRWNKNGVCENPEGYSPKLTAPAYCTVFFAQDDTGIWRAGYNYGIKGSGENCFGQTGVPNLNADGYGDHSFAVLAELEDALKAFEKCKHKAAPKAHRELAAAIERFKSDLPKGDAPAKKPAKKAGKGGAR
jgi:ParB/RepB/Spo0J family partition protein